ncbi:MAG: adenylate/guanylate cyclase domain-containing protein, partial [Acetobacteraceae bacterium]|nr:adenylate/guanylate cyclase domain-containing protein [Acetobacteraceae bacterium]
MIRVTLRRRLAEAARVALILALATGGALLCVRPPSPLAAAERLFEAAAFRLFAPVRPLDERIVIVEITEDTLDLFPYRSPIDRTFLAGVLDQLASAGVAAIGLDVLLDRPTEPAKDAALRRAIRRRDVPVVAITLGPETPASPERRRTLAGFVAGVRTGTANLARDRFDDLVREHVPIHPATGEPSFAASLAAALGAPVPARPFPIAWRRTPGRHAFPVYPAEAVRLLPPDWLRGKVALVGSLRQGEDEHRTLASAFGQPSFGVEIHAQILSQLLDRRAVPSPPIPWTAILVTLGMAAAGLAAASVLTGYILAAALAGIGAAFVTAALAGYAGGLALVPCVAPVLAMAAAAAAFRAWRGRAERRDRRALQALFSRFLSEPVADALMRDRELFLAGGRPRPQVLTATVLFCDIAGSTAICERLAPEPLIAWFDLYLNTMVQLVIEHEGVVLRFVGDGVLAAFGCPVPRRDEAGVTEDARNATRCALAMERAMERLNDGWREAGLPETGLRVGLHTGELVAGSLGSGPRLEYCLLGDTANVGARLEQLGKEFADGAIRYCTILVGEPTWQRLGGTV